MSTSFSGSEVKIPHTAHLEDVFTYVSAFGEYNAEVTFEYELLLKDDSNARHWNKTRVSLTIAQAQALHNALGLALATPLPEPGDVKYIISDMEAVVDAPKPAWTSAVTEDMTKDMDGNEVELLIADLNDAVQGVCEDFGIKA